MARAAPTNPAPVRTPSLRRAQPIALRRRFADSIADYRYVVSDLRRIGMVAGSLVVLLVVLSFVIR